MTLRNSYQVAIIFIFQLFFLVSCKTEKPGNTDINGLFDEAMEQPWKMLMEDDFTDDWQKQWFLDGQTARVVNTPEGMEFYAGGFNEQVPAKQVPAYHATMWTHRVFGGDLKIEYEYTKLDTVNQFVSIFYLFAEGSGSGPYDKDISRWNDLRTVSAMKEYFNHMNAYHISYSAVDAKGDTLEDYIRGRRYLPEHNGLDGTEMHPEYFNTGFFEIGIPHHITIINRGDYIFMKVASSGKSRLFHFDKREFPPINSGRIGIRMMNFRAALFSNFKVYTLSE